MGGGPNLRQANVYGVPNSVDPAAWLTPGLTSGALTTSDHYYSDGFYSPRPWPLGDGTYFWPMTPDHPNGAIDNWADGQDFRFGFSSDPQIMPSAINAQAMPLCGYGNNTVTNPSTTGQFCTYHGGNALVVEPNDSAGMFHWYSEGTDITVGPGLTMTGTVSSSSGVVTGIADTSKLVGGGSSVAWGGAAATITGSCIIGTVYINTVDSPTQITMSDSANTNGSCELTFLNPFAQHTESLMRASNINGPWTLYGPVTNNYWGGASGGGFSSLGRPTRLGDNNWSYFTNSSAYPGRRIDGNMVTGSDVGGAFSATFSEPMPDNGLMFQRLPPDTVVHLNTTIPTGYTVAVPCSDSPFQCVRTFMPAQWDKATVNGQDWICAVEDDRNVLISSANPAVVAKAAHGLSVGNPVYFETGGYEPGNDPVIPGTNTVTGINTLGPIEVGQEVNFTSYNASAAPLVSWPQHTYVTNISSGPPYTLTMSNNAIAAPGGSVVDIWALPLPLMRDVTYYVQSVIDADHFTLAATNGGAAISTLGHGQAGQQTMPAGGQYVARVAVDAAMNILASPAPVRVSAKHYGIFPGPTYLQNVNCQYEHGVMTYLATRGFANSMPNFGFVMGAPYNSGDHKPYNYGGALWHQMVDIYSEVLDPAAATSAAPMGFQVSSSAAGVVTFKWNDALPMQTYRLYRASSSNSNWTLVGDVTGLTATDTPNLQLPQMQYYKLVYLNGGA
jgi:hypothetical protein